MVLGISQPSLTDATNIAWDKRFRHPAGILAQVEEGLRNLYAAGFSLPDCDREGKFHQLEIQTTHAGVKSRACKGYVAEG